MSYFTVAVLLVSIGFLAYRQSPRWFKRIDNHQLAQREGSPQDRTTRSDEDKTPTFKATVERDDVPTLSLTSDDTEAEIIPSSSQAQDKAFFPASQSDMPPPPRVPSNPSPNTMPPPPKPTPRQPPSSKPNLMPPPSLPSPSTNRQPSSASSLRIPTTGPLPNRGPPLHSQQRASSSLSPQSTVPSTKPRQKVILTPGHSPMDWAALTRTPNLNLSGVPTLQRVTPTQLKSMTGRKGKPAWSCFRGKVYNVTPYVKFHPGGEAELMRGAGRDATALFQEVHPWVNVEGMLEGCLVGILVGEGQGGGGADGDEEEGLEGID